MPPGAITGRSRSPRTPTSSRPVPTTTGLRVRADRTRGPSAGPPPTSLAYQAQGWVSRGERDEYLSFRDGLGAIVDN